MNNVCEKQISMKNLRQEIQEGFWGSDIKSSMDKLTEAESDMIIAVLYRQIKGKSRRLYFCEAMSILFPCSVCYYHIADEKFILCLPYPKNDVNTSRLRLITDLFLDVTSKCEPFWEKHIGIIGVAKTMRIGKIAVYGL